jgi:hypothetical protein
VSARLQLQNGQWQKMELNYGSSFLSQSSRFINLPAGVKAVELTDSKGSIKKIALPENAQ